MPQNNGPPFKWDELSSEEIRQLQEAGVDTVILPVGSTEQHGAHLPVGVDAIIPDEIAQRVSARIRVPVLPCLRYGNSLTHRGWHGTVSLRPETLQRVIEEVVRWPYASGFRRFVILNGHLANPWPLLSAMDNLRYDLPAVRIRVLSWWDITPELGREVRLDAVGPSFHANNAETSVMMYLRPDLVRMDRVQTEQSAERPFFSYPMRFRTPSGVTGDPLSATRERGETLVEMAVTGLESQLRAAMHEQPPYPDPMVAHDEL